MTAKLFASEFEKTLRRLNEAGDDLNLEALRSTADDMHMGAKWFEAAGMKFTPADLLAFAREVQLRREEWIKWQEDADNAR